MENNLYRPHPFMIDSGTFWRCKHGTTGYGSKTTKNGRPKWEGCRKCAFKAPFSWLKHKIRVARM